MDDLINGLSKGLSEADASTIMNILDLLGAVILQTRDQTTEVTRSKVLSIEKLQLAIRVFLRQLHRVDEIVLDLLMSSAEVTVGSAFPLSLLGNKKILGRATSIIKAEQIRTLSAHNIYYYSARLLSNSSCCWYDG